MDGKQDTDDKGNCLHGSQGLWPEETTGLLSALESNILKLDNRVIDSRGVAHRYTREIPDLVYHLGAQIGSIRVFADHTRKNKRKVTASRIFACLAAFYVCSTSLWDYSRCRWNMHLTNHGYSNYGKNLNIPNFSSCRDENEADRVLTLVYLWV